MEYVCLTGHTLETTFPLPASTKEEVASLGVNPTRILRGKITYTAVVLTVVFL